MCCQVYEECLGILVGIDSYLSNNVIGQGRLIFLECQPQTPPLLCRSPVEAYGSHELKSLLSLEDKHTISRHCRYSPHNFFIQKEHEVTSTQECSCFSNHFHPQSFTNHLRSSHNLSLSHNPLALLKTTSNYLMIQPPQVLPWVECTQSWHKFLLIGCWLLGVVTNCQLLVTSVDLLNPYGSTLACFSPSFTSQQHPFNSSTTFGLGIESMYAYCECTSVHRGLRCSPNNQQPTTQLLLPAQLSAFLF